MKKGDLVVCLKNHEYFYELNVGQLYRVTHFKRYEDTGNTGCGIEELNGKYLREYYTHRFSVVRMSEYLKLLK